MYEYDWSRIPCSDPREYIELREEFVYFFFYHNIGAAGSQGGDRGEADLQS
jgi:hypothetical protein